MNAQKSTRRNFLKKTSFLPAAFLFVPAGVLGKDNQTAANDRINVGCIGVGSRGTDVMRGFLRNSNCQVIALCDVKSNVLAEKQNLVNQFYSKEDCKTYHDFRDLAAREDIDACLVATCDHWHVLASLAVVRSGKDVYTEKPLGLTLEEDHALRAAVHQHSRIFQFGTQQRSEAPFRQACEIVRSGLIGDIHTINVWSPGSVQGGNPVQVPIPEWLDYDFWLGPARYTPYSENRCSNELWWYISDYALGFIAGWGIHPLDIALWGAEEKFQGLWELEGKGEYPTQGVCDTAITWDVRIKLSGGTTLYYRGAPSAGEWKQRYSDDSDHGTAFEGSKGWVYVRRGKIDANPKNLLDAKIEESLYQSANHVDNFLDGVRTRKETISPIDVAVRGDTLCHISDIAIRREEKLLFDSQKETFVDNSEANKRLMRPMRKSWHL